MKFTGRAYGVTTARRATRRPRSNPEWGVKGYRVQVLDTINDDKTVQDIRGDGKEQARFEAFLARYDYPRYVVQIVDNATDEVVQDNQGREGSVRKFEPRRANHGREYRSLSIARGDFSGAESRQELADQLRRETALARTPAEIEHALNQVSYAAAARSISSAQADKLRAPLYARKGVRANPPMLAILNPLPPHLERYAKAQRLNADERAEFNQAIARYCEFHDVSPDDIKIEPWGEVEGDAKRFLVGLGKAEDVSYSVNTKGRFRDSNKKGTPFRHEIEAPDTMLATTPDGEMTIIINKPGAKRKMVVQDWMRG